MCSRTDLNGILAIVASKAKKIFGDKLKEVILFGSYARGDYDMESDIDIAILADISRSDESKYNKQIIKMIGDIYEEKGYSVVLSPIVISADFFEEWKNDLPFYRNVASEGVRIVA